MFGHIRNLEITSPKQMRNNMSVDPIAEYVTQVMRQRRSLLNWLRQFEPRPYGFSYMWGPYPAPVIVWIKDDGSVVDYYEAECPEEFDPENPPKGGNVSPSLEACVAGLVARTSGLSERDLEMSLKPL